jgi:glycosyltransferase involved in cell wall biosynthesis
LEALKIIKKKGRSLKLVVYVGEGCIGLEEGKRRVREIGIDEITWSDFLYGRRLAEEYQKSIGCLIPYTGGSGRYPATSAMANATPVIATRKASLPEYLGDLGIFIKDESAEELAEAVIRLMDNPSEVTALGGKLRERVSERFNWDVVARKTLKVYEEISG